jgi:proline racemase
MRAQRVITVVGAHAAGEVGRVITGGVLPPPGESVLAQQQWLAQHGDDLRRFLLYEPRGGAFTHANLVVPATHPDADAGFIIMEPENYVPMSGSNCICTVTVLLETGMLPIREPVTELTLEAPGGLVPVVADCRDGQVLSVRLTNVPSFAALLDAEIDVPGHGKVTLDVAYGGAFFAIVDARRFGFDITRAEARRLVELGETIKEAGRVEAAATLSDGTPAILPSIAGRAWITGYHSYVLHPEDPWPQGYTLGDTWYRVLEPGNATEGPKDGAKQAR